MQDIPDIWQACHGPEQLRPLMGNLVRLVESQLQVATLQLVDTLEEQALLESLLEGSKPPLPTGSEGLHYLLKTPFRYPPLRWGSRFGRVHEPALFYGATRIETVMAESAYYRFVLWDGMALPPPSGRIRSEHSSFEARYQATQGLRLQAAPFSRYETVLIHPRDYRATQQLGSAMRAAGIEAFEYRSARCLQQGINVALYTAAAFRERQPRRLTPWLCETTLDYVAFKPVHAPDPPRFFPRTAFLVDGGLPLPA